MSTDEGTVASRAAQDLQLEIDRQERNLTKDKKDRAAMSRSIIEAERGLAELREQLQTLTNPPKPTYDFTPMQEMVVELLAARYRLGEKAWTLPKNTTMARALNELAATGVLSYKETGPNGSLYLAWLEQPNNHIDDNYTPPALQPGM